MLLAVIIIGIGIGVITSQLALRYVLPYVQLEKRRRESRAHMPQPHEIWVQDDGMLYIEAVSDTGVDLLTMDPLSKSLHRWHDSWAEWQQRVRKRSVWFTGHMKALT